MKRFLPLLIVLVLVIGLFIFSVNYRNTRQAQTDNSTYSSTSVETTDEADTILTEADVIVSNDEGGYKLYYKNKVATLTYKDAEIKFETWAKSIAIETPTMYYNDFDNDGEKELIVKIIEDFSDITGEEEYSYALYLFKPSEVDGKTELSYITAQSGNWRKVFKNSIRFEVTQLPMCKKFIQFAMNDSKKVIEYDEQTGLTDNKHVSYARADYNDKKEYYTIEKYNKGLGIYNVLDNGDVTLDIQVIIKYVESDKYYHIGNIHCEMVVDGGVYKVRPYTISFIPLDSYVIANPQTSAPESWEYTVSNLSAGSDSSLIDFIDIALSISTANSSQSQYYGNQVSDIKNVDTIICTDKSITLKAKSGYSFDAAQIENGKFSVIDANQLDISYTAQVKGDSLIINLDKSYTKEELSEIRITFGL